MAKLLLIADENRGGFPNSKKTELDTIYSERNHEMRQPGLVARLMGLESMPTVRRDKAKKPTSSDFSPNQEKKYTNNPSNRSSELFRCDNEDSNLEKCQTKMEARPQKLQKTRLFERRSVNRFGAEALQFKGVLSRSKKHQQKLVSPVKSPRILSGRNAARLMEAATKILEPGLQSTSRAKCTLTYTPSLHRPPRDEIMIEGTTVVPLDHSKQSENFVSAAKPLKGQASCKSCGNLLDVVDFRSSVEEQEPGFASSFSDLSNSPPQGSGKSKPRSPISSLDQKRDMVVLKNQERQVSVAAHSKANMHIRTENITDRRPPFRENQDNSCMMGQRYKSQKDVPASTVIKQRTQRQNQVLTMKDRVPPRPKTNNLQGRRYMSGGDVVNRTKGFASLNRNANCQTRPRMPSRVLDNRKVVNTEGNACDGQDGSPSRLKPSIRKRRPLNGSGQVGKAGSVSCIVKQRNTNGKGVELNTGIVNRSHIKSGSPSKAGVGTTGGKGNEIVSFMFSSPMRQIISSSSPTQMEKRRGQGELIGSSVSQQKKQILDTNYGNPSPRTSPLKLDALGVLLEQKLKELTCQERDESIGGTASGRTTASILQELISALTAVGPISQECPDNSIGIDEGSSSCYSSPKSSELTSAHGQAFKTNRKLQVEGGQVGLLHSNDTDHPSPGSVLEACFSNDSCYSGSLDDSSGHNLHSESMGCSYDQSQPSSLIDADLSDSATSFNMRRAGYEVAIDSTGILSRIFHSIDLANIGLTGTKLDDAREVIMHAELMFGNITLSHADGMASFLTGPLLDKLDALADTFWRSYSCNLSFKEAKEGFLLRSFHFDCIIECLDSKYSHYCKSGYKTWAKLPLHMSRELLLQEVYDEVRRWSDFAGKIPDEIIEREMSHALGKWTDFEIEAFEAGTEVELDILDILMDEIVMDLWQCGATFSWIL
ncbi:PREDICTED: uncharacterized protein LOC104602912 isoform X2 [Nelumbo nucifera]|nr:PREDICTED: uncharacterized protein LOC104602912 isoform X2 [Nelumbo nucifera]